MIKRIQELVQRRKWDKIRKGYEDLIEKNPKDTRSRLKLGDLYAKQGKVQEAVAQYMECAEIFAKAGFHLKSIALYKQILRFQPQSVSALRRAAQISYQYGLYADAYPYYEHLARVLRTHEGMERLWEIFQELSHLPLKETKQKVRVFEAIFPEEGVRFVEPYDRLCQVGQEMSQEEGSFPGALTLARWIASFYPDRVEGHELFVSLLHRAGKRVELEEAIKRLEAVYRDAEILQEKQGFLDQFRPGGDSGIPASDALDEAPGGRPPALSDQVKVKMEANIYDLLKEKSGQTGGEEAGPEETSPLERIEFDDLFDNFKQGIQGQVAKDDYETHYNLGVAYHEMGLYEDALQELEIAANDPDLQYDAYFLMARCARDIDRPEEALGYYAQALADEGLDRDQRMGMRYEQAVTLRSLGRDEQALEIFREIQQEASNYRDTERQIEEILAAAHT